MTKAKRFSFVALAAVTAVGLLFFAQSGADKTDLGQSTFPELTSANRVELPPEEGEEIRYLYFAPDGVKRKLTQIEYRSGVTSLILYRGDGVAKETRSFFPPLKGDSKRKLRSLITYQDDGRSYKSHQVYREDGSLERNGGRLSEGEYQTLYFNGKDGSVQRRLVYSTSSQLESEESFSDEGKLLEKTEQVSDSELKTTRWNADGKLISEINDMSDGRRSGKLYFEDGKTVKIEFNHRGYQIEVQYFDKDGKIAFEVEHVEQGMAVTTFGPGEKALFKQYWLLTGGKTLCDATYRLAKVEEFHKWGDERDKRELLRVIGVDADGKPNLMLAPVNMTYSYERTETVLYPDGSVKQERVYDKSNQVSSSRTFVQGEQKSDLKPELFVKPVIECLDPPNSKFKETGPSEGEEPTED
ncbi:MAG: hypothetical protein SGJ27_05520 [Candidatus Melainabacteria bacterium]|nr:hypothetical protein [Candidatus Melainabacteria bacterium]